MRSELEYSKLKLSAKEKRKENKPRLMRKEGEEASNLKGLGRGGVYMHATLVEVTINFLSILGDFTKKKKRVQRLKR